MKTIQTHLVDNNISWTVGQRCTRHVMNYVNLVNMDLIRPYPQRQDHKNPLKFFGQQQPDLCVSSKRHLFISPQNPALHLPNVLVENATWFLVSRVKPQRRGIQTKWSKEHSWCTSLSNISKYKFYFWNEKKIPEIQTKVNLKQSNLDDPYYPLSWLLVRLQSHGFFLVLHLNQMFLEGYLNFKLQCYDIFAYGLLRTPIPDPGKHLTWEWCYNVRCVWLTQWLSEMYLKKTTDSVTNFVQVKSEAMHISCNIDDDCY